MSPASLFDAFVILQTPDLPRAVAFYTERLGFEERYRFPDDGAAAFTVVALNEFSLGLAETTDVAPAGRVALWLYADDVDAELESLRTAGVPVAKEPADMEWGERVGSILDPDGNEVFIGQRLAL